MREGCENPLAGQKGCNQDQKSFKAYISRWLTVTSLMVPSTHTNITALLRSSAEAAAKQCSGGPRGTQCGIQWDKDGTWDGNAGVGQSMSALEVILGTMIGLPAGKNIKPPVTSDSGGTSVSNPAAGHPEAQAPVTVASTKDKAGAWFLTVLIALIAVFAIYFMWSETFEHGGSTVGGLGRKGKGRVGGGSASGVLEKIGVKSSERVVIDLHTGKRRSVGGEGGLMVGREDVMMSPVSPGFPPQAHGGEGNRASVPRYRGGDQVT